MVIEPLVRSIYTNYSLLRPWSTRPVADILVRVPGPAGDFQGSVYKVVPRTLDLGQPLEAQLLGLDTLVGQGIGEDGSFEGSDSNWLYADPVARLENYISANTGDILVLANVRHGYQFGGGYKGNHGSLTKADAQVPIAFGYPGSTGPNDTTFKPLANYLATPGATEALAMRVFLLGPGQ